MLTIKNQIQSNNQTCANYKSGPEESLFTKLSSEEISTIQGGIFTANGRRNIEFNALWKSPTFYVRPGGRMTLTAITHNINKYGRKLVIDITPPFIPISKT